LSAIPLPDPRQKRARQVLSGDVPTPLDPPSGCRFHTRCPAVFDRCSGEEPALIQLHAGHTSKCHHADGLSGDSAWFDRLNQRIERQERENEAERARSLEAAAVPADGISLPEQLDSAARAAEPQAAEPLEPARES